MIRVQWTGAAGLAFINTGAAYLIDPFISRPDKLSVLFRKLEPRTSMIANWIASLDAELKAVMIGHTHFDHALDIPVIAENRDVCIVGSSSLDALLSAHALPGRVTVCRGGERISLPGEAAVTMLPAQHGKVALGRIPYPGEIDPHVRPPLKATDYRHGQVFSMLLELGGLRFLHVGSAGLTDAPAPACDVLFLCVPGWQKTLDFHRRILKHTRPRVVVPFHFDDFTTPNNGSNTVPDLPLLAKRAFLREVQRYAPQAEIIWPRINQPLSF